jgi:hypothetical protein
MEGDEGRGREASPYKEASAQVDRRSRRDLIRPDVFLRGGRSEDA